MFKSIRAYINRIRTSLFGRMERMKESSKRMAFERKRKTLRRFLRNGLRVENLEGRALMAVDMNVISSPMAITMNAANDTATISRLPAATPYPASLMVQTNTADPDQDPDVTGDETYTFIRTAGTGTNGITVSDVGSNAGQVLTIGGDLAISNPKGTDRAISSFTATGIETINLDQAINVSGSVSGNADTVNVDDPGKVAQAVSLVKAAGTVNIDAGAYSDDEVTVNKEGLTVNVSAGVSGVSLALGTANNITLTGAGDMNVTGNSNNNTITANAGANVIDGGAGVDQVVYNVAGDTYESFVVGYDGTTITLTKGGKVDSITNVESIQFTNKTLRVVPAGGSIQGAVDAAAANDVLLIAAGSFNENVTISKVLTVFGANAGKAGADNTRGSETMILGKLTMTAAATVDGVLLTKPSNSSDTGSGINFTNWDGINAVIGNGSALRCSIVEAFGAHGGFGGSGFVNMTAGGATLESSLVRAGTGYNAAGDVRGVASVVVSAAGSFVIDGNTLSVSTNNADAVNIPAGTSVTVTDNIISGVDGGIVAYAAFGGLTITGNNVNSYNDNGIRVFNHTGANPTVVTIADNAVSGANPLLVDTSAALQYVIDGASAVSLTTTTQLSGILADNTISTLKAERYVSWTPQDFVMDSVTVKAAYVGAADDDLFTGTSANELFVGGLGTNTIDGGAGTDRASYIGSYADYTVSFNGSTVTVTGEGLSDTLNNIESVKFADKMVWVVPAGGSIQGVVDAATAGDVLLISTGTFTGNVTVNKALSILGPFANVVGTDNSRSAIAGTGEATIVGMFKVSSTGSVTISGLRFLNNASSGIGGPSNPALQRQAASAGGDHTYSNNIFYSTESAGDNTTGDRAISFEVLGSGSTTVSGNYITGNGTTSDKYGSARWNRGIWSDGGGSSSITISNNTIEYARSAMTIDVAGDATYTITNNTARISGTGISFGLNAAGGAGNITGMVVDNVDTDFNFQNLSQAVTFSLATALSNTVPSTETVVVLGGTAGDTLTGSSTVDYFTPNAGGDTVALGSGDDFLFLTDSAHVTGDNLDGGAGTDTIRVTGIVNSSNVVTNPGQSYVLPAATVGFETVQISRANGDTTGVEVFNLDASAVSTGLSIKGNDGANILKATQGNDTITANAGNDVIHGNAGNDTIDGGAGTDSAVFSGNYSAYTIAFSGSNVTVSGPDGSDTVTNVEKLTFADRSVYIVNGAGSTITTISDAVSAASEGDVVFSGAGTYTLPAVSGGSGSGALTLSKAGIELRGASQDSVILKASGANTSREHAVIRVNATGITFRDLTVAGWTTATSSSNAGNGYQVWLNNTSANNTTFDGVKFVNDNIRVSIYNGTANGLTVTDSRFEGYLYRYGIRGAGTGLTITDNVFDLGFYGSGTDLSGPIEFEYGALTSGVISGNLFKHGVGVTVLSNDATGEFSSQSLFPAITNFQPNKITADGLVITDNDFEFVNASVTNTVTGFTGRPVAIYSSSAPSTGPVTITGNNFKGYGYHPTNVTVPSVIDAGGDRVHVLDFDGVQERAEFTMPASIGSEGSISVWINPTDVGSTRRSIYNGGGIEVTLRNGTIYFYPNSGQSGSLTYATNSSLSANTWTHVLVTWNLATKTTAIYFNGVEATYQVSYTPPRPNWTTAADTAGKIVAVGYDPANAERYFPGRMDDFAVFSSVLTSQQRSDVMNGVDVNTSALPSLVALWSPTASDVGQESLPGAGGTATKLRLDSAFGATPKFIDVRGGTGIVNIDDNTYENDSGLLATSLSGGTGNDQLIGTPGADTIDGGTGDDVIEGGLGDDSLSGGSGANTVDGGAGFDLAYFSGSITDYTLSFEGDSITVTNIANPGDTTVLEGVESLRFASDTGSTLVVGGPGSQYTTIQSAIDAASANDTVLVYPGTYAEALNINKAYVTVKSLEGAATTFITGVDPTYGTSVRFTANGVTLGGANAGFTIDNGNTADGRAIAPQGFSGGTISGNTIVNAYRGVQGDFYGRPASLSITGNTFADSVSYGIAGTEEMTNLVVSGNTFSTSVEAIGLGAGVTGVTAADLMNDNTFTLSAAGDEATYGVKDYNTNTIYVKASDSLQAAINGASANDTVNVSAGTYGPIVIPTAGVSVVTTAGATLQGSDAEGVTVRFAANDVSLEGFTVDNQDAADGRAIAPQGFSGGTISGNTIVNAYRGVQGDFYGRPTSLSITGNTFADSVSYGIAGTEDITNLVVSGNTFSTSVEAIGLGAGVTGVTAADLMNDNTFTLSAAGDDATYGVKDYNTNTIYVKASDSLQAAINGASANDTVNVSAGTYGPIVIPTAGVSVVTTAGATLQGSDAEGVTVRFAANDVSLEGFTVDNQNAADGRAIAPQGFSGGTVSGNTIVNAFRGVQGDFYGRPTNLTITDNVFASTVSYGIAGTEDMSLTAFSGNTFNTSVEGIGLGSGVSLVGNALDADGIFDLLADQTVSLVDGYALKDYRTATLYVVQGATIQNALDASQDNDSVVVGAGTYAEFLTISTDVSVVSHAGAGSTSITGVDPTYGTTVRITSDGVTLGGVGAGFTIDNGNTSDGRAIAPQGTTGAAIIGNTIVNAYRGIQGDFYGVPQNLTITGNTFSGTVSYGIAGTEGMSIVALSGNTFNTTVEGIGFGAGVTGVPDSTEYDAIFSLLDDQTVALTSGYILKDYRSSSIYVLDGSSIQSAVSAASAGDTVRLQAGVYTDGSVTTSVNNLTIDVPAGVSGLTGLVLGGSVTNGSATLSGVGAADLTGNTGDNTLTGNTGANTIDGGAGNDTASYPGAYDSYTLTFNNSSVSISGPDGADTLSNIEKISFSDKTVVLVGGFGSQYTTISQGVTAAGIGDIVMVAAGTYTEQVNINKSLTLLSISGAASTTITSSAGGYVGAVTVASGVKEVTLGDSNKGFTLNSNAANPAALYFIGDNDGAVVRGNTINGGSTGALLVGGAQDSMTFDANQFSNSVNVPLAYVNGVASLGNSQASTGVNFTNNTFTGSNATGLLLGNEAANSTITGNTFTGANSYAQLEVWEAGNTISGNTFSGAKGKAIVDGGEDYNAATLVAANTFQPGSIYIADKYGVYTSIQLAINTSVAGDSLVIGAGAYTENLTIDKWITLTGAGSGSDATANTVISSAAGSTPVITVSAGGVSSTDRLVIDGLRVTGATGEINAGAGILVASSSAISYLTLSNFVSTGNQGAGVAFNSTAAVSDVVISDATISSNGNAGIRIATAVPSFTGLAVSDTAITSNASSGFSYNPSGTISNVGTDFNFTDVTFTNNNTAETANQHEMSFFGFKGNATLTRVTLSLDQGNAYGIAFVGRDTRPALGTVSLTDVSVTGTMGKGALTFQQYSDVSGVTLSNVDLSAATAPWGHFILDSTDTDALALGTTTLKTLVLWNAGGVDATAATFKHVTTGATLNRNTLDDNFQIANQVGDKVDVAALGYVSWNAGNVYVTPSSYSATGGTTIADVQRAVSAASVGDTVWVQTGAYVASSATTSVNNLTLNVADGVTGFTGLVLDGTVTNGNASLAGAADVSLTGNAGNNTLTGNDGDNVITGGLGNDTIDGGTGSNTAVFSGNYADYTITLSSPISISGPDGVDSLTNIQNLQFSDITIPVDEVATTLSISATSVTYGEDGVVEVTVARDDSGTPLPSGTVSLIVNSNSPITANLVDGVATFTLLNLAAGTYTLEASYAAQGVFAASDSDPDDTTDDSLVVNKKTISIVGVTANDKVYDSGTTAVVDMSGASYSGLVYGESFTVTGTPAGVFDSKNVGSQTVTITGLTAPSDNYELDATSVTDTAEITPLDITGSFTASNKTYDGLLGATVTGRTVSPLSGDDLQLTGGTATFGDKNVGTRTVSLTGANLTGTDAGNYNLTSVETTQADITAISLTGAFTVSATKVYDGNTSATVVTRTIPTGVLSGETVTLVGGTAAYSNRHVADGKTVSLSGASLGGVDSGNYILDSVTNTTANITKKDVTGSFTVDPRQYDGTNVAIVASTSITKENNDDVVLLNFIGEGDAATFNNAFVGNGKLVTPKSPVAGNWSLSGAEAGNYNLTSMNTTTANITKRTLTPTVTVNNRVYNGTTAATINTITSDKLELDDVTVTATSAAFNDKNVGVGKTATVSGLSLSGSSASQYELASTTASATGTVTKAPLTLNFLVTATKVYDGTDTANITASNLTPPVFGDDAVGITGVVAKYDSKNVGANKPVTIADGYSLTGADAGNYEVTAFSPRTASITAKSLSVTSWAADNKVYDGTNAATISIGTVFAGLVSGDTVTLGGTATFANKNAGDGKVVTLASPSLTGADGGNYSLSGSVGTVTANISKKTLTPVYSASSKFFDGNNVATVTLQSDDRISGDALTISYVSATFADSAIGANKDVTISTISVSGTDSVNYQLNATSQTLTASINNNAPVVTTSSGNTPYGLGNVTVIDAAIAVADFESTYAVSQDPNSPLSLGGGSMTVSVTENQGPDDYLLISAQGSAAGQIDIDEGTSEVLYGGVVIGTYAGGYETPLVITFGSSATLESVQALARRIAFSNSNMETTIEARTVSFVVNDGIDSSDAATKSVTISASNQPPVLTPSAGSTNFTEGNGNTIAAPVRVDNSMTVSDTDQLNFDTGVLTVSLGATGTADDRLSIISSNSIGTINVSGSSVRIVTGVSPSLTAVEIGTFTGGTNGSDPLVVTLNAEATVARTQLLVRAVGFQNVSNAPSTDARSVEFQLSDGAGATSTPVTKTVTVTATNDLPVVVLSDSTPTFTEPTGPTTDVEALPVAELIDNGVSISDPDNPASFDGGNVTATIVSGGIATSDRFGIRQIGGITVSGADAGVESVNAVATATVSHDGVVFGTISLPTNAVRITFNSEATLERVEALARALTVRNTSDLPGSNRLLRVQVTDNASGTSAFVTKTVTVVSTNDIPRITGAATTSLNLSRTAASATNALGGGVTSFVDSFANGAPSDMNGGTLTASMKRDGNSSANVQLSIIAGTGITLSGNDIIHTSSSVATTFGTITSAHPASGGDLTITFNANANGTRITALLKQLRVRAVSGATTGSHVLTVTLTEPDTDTVSITRPFNVT